MPRIRKSYDRSCKREDKQSREKSRHPVNQVTKRIVMIAGTREQSPDGWRQELNSGNDLPDSPDTQPHGNCPRNNTKKFLRFHVRASNELTPLDRSEWQFKITLTTLDIRGNNALSVARYADVASPYNDRTQAQPRFRGAQACSAVASGSYCKRTSYAGHQKNDAV